MLIPQKSIIIIDIKMQNDSAEQGAIKWGI